MLKQHSIKVCVCVRVRVSLACAGVTIISIMSEPDADDVAAHLLQLALATDDSSSNKSKISVNDGTRLQGCSGQYV